MPWLKTGDNAAHHPIVMAVREHPRADDRLLNEAYGFTLRCAQLAAAHLTDYVVSRGTAIDLAGSISRADELIEVCRFAGYFTDRREIDGRTFYTLVQDPEFIHMRLKAEIDWERQRKRDNSNPALIVPVRWRDGDACRHCGAVVNWEARTGGRAGTYQHLRPGEPGTVDTVVVACKSCNSAAGDNPTALPLLPEPDRPHYGEHTRAWFTKSDWAKRHGYVLAPARPASQADTATPRPGTQPDPAPAQPARPRPAAQAETATQRPGTRPDPAPAPSTRRRGPTPSRTPPRPQGDQAPSRTSHRRDPPARRTPRPSDPAPSRTPHPHTTAATTPPAAPVRNRQDLTETQAPFPDGAGSGRDGPGREPAGRARDPARARNPRGRRARRRDPREDP